MIPVSSPAAGSRPAASVDEIHCTFCSRVHRPAPADAATEAVVEVCDVVFAPEVDDTGPSPARQLVCTDCRLRHIPSGEYGRTIESVTPVDALEQALAIEPEVHDEIRALTDGETQLGALEQAQLYAVANRLLLRQGRDHSTAHAIVRAAQMEAQLVTRIAGDTAARITRQMWWRDNALQAIAARLFPNKDAKTKSVRLTYGTIGRKDFKPAPELVDDQAALAACRVSGDYDDCLTLSVDAPLDTFRDALEHVLTEFYASRVGIGGEPGDGEQTPYTVEDALAFLVANETASVDLAWGRLKKALAQSSATIAQHARHDGGPVDLDPALLPAGVKMTEPSTEYYAKVTEG